MIGKWRWRSNSAPWNTNQDSNLMRINLNDFKLKSGEGRRHIIKDGVLADKVIIVTIYLYNDHRPLLHLQMNTMKSMQDSYVPIKSHQIMSYQRNKKERMNGTKIKEKK